MCGLLDSSAEKGEFEDQKVGCQKGDGSRRGSHRRVPYETQRLSWARERQEGFQEFAGLCLGNSFWGQWGGSKAVGGDVWSRAMSVKRSRRVEAVSKSSIHKSMETGWEMGICLHGFWALAWG